MAQLADVQNHSDNRGISLGKVGVSNLYHPLIIRDKANGTQSVTAKFDISVGLHPEQRGAHLSHLVDGIHRYRAELFSMDNLVNLIKDIRAKQDQDGIPFDNAYISIKFKYFVEKTAPVSGSKSLVGYDCGFQVVLDSSAHKSVSVTVPVSTVCPCSLEISDLGAHNQRSYVTIKVDQQLDDSNLIWLEDLITIAEDSGSSETFTVLRRLDEKEITERMFASPNFVEDVVRNGVQLLSDQFCGISYSVRCESTESIHPHNAYAETTGKSQQSGTF